MCCRFHSCIRYGCSFSDGDDDDDDTDGAMDSRVHRPQILLGGSQYFLGRESEPEREHRRVYTKRSVESGSQSKNKNKEITGPRLAWPGPAWPYPACQPNGHFTCQHSRKPFPALSGNLPCTSMKISLQFSRIFPCTSGEYY